MNSDGNKSVSKGKTIFQRFFDKNTSLEHEQARFTIYLYIIAASWSLFSSLRGWNLDHPNTPLIFLLLLFVAMGLSIHTFMFQPLNTKRQWFKNILDWATMIFGFYNGYIFVWTFFACCVMPVGNGFRFGPKALLVGITGNVIILIGAYFLNDYYHREPIVWMTVFLFVSISVGYISVIVVKLHALKKRLAELAMHDGLTGMPNRRLFMEHLRQHMLESRRSKKKVACFFLDLDGFKSVNDKLGHPTGDKLLIKVASTIKSRLRNGDIAARLGGDEFVIVAASNFEPQETLQLAERILHGIEGIRSIGQNSITVSASIGVAYYFSESGRSILPDPDKLLDAADRSMYQAKTAGKGRIVISTEIISDD
jgi:diguanylate cyclase (GGDEF)-like protein